jgi:hypothetical protein
LDKHKIVSYIWGVWEWVSTCFSLKFEKKISNDFFGVFELFDVLMSKINLKNKKNIILILFKLIFFKK